MDQTNFNCTNNIDNNETHWKLNSSLPCIPPAQWIEICVHLIIRLIQFRFRQTIDRSLHSFYSSGPFSSDFHCMCSICDECKYIPFTSASIPKRQLPQPFSILSEENEMSWHLANSVAFRYGIVLASRCYIWLVLIMDSDGLYLQQIKAADNDHCH